ncbi:hypothetical protein EU538_01805 [Candidatus Thorarchaeota archaeon]|nr:MAG: hypothetical protein EU538_01805 [Candidatus Thorarchaeota archaeon]
MKSLSKTESAKVSELRRVSDSLESADLQIMYAAAGEMVALPYAFSLIPKAFALTHSDDATICRLAFRTLGQNVYGKYVSELFKGLAEINPAEREQVLQVIEERLKTRGSPDSPSEQDHWIEALDGLGREHQPTVFGILSTLNRKGANYVKKLLTENIGAVSLGSIQKISDFPRSTRNRFIRLLVKVSMDRRKELLPYILEIMDSSSIKYASPYLQSERWQERVKVAERVGYLGVSRASGIVMEVVADEDWRVKQALLENITLEKSKLTSVQKILEYMVKDSHARVRRAADRLILQLGTTQCVGSSLQNQRKRIQKSFRKQLLRAAPVNKDVDSQWLGVDVELQDPIPYMDEEEEGGEGMSLSDLKEPPKRDKAAADARKSLLGALMSAQKKARDEKPELPQVASVDDFDIGDPDLDPEERFLVALKALHHQEGKDVAIELLRAELASHGMDENEFNTTLEEFERNGIVYRSGEGTVSYVDIEL